MDFPYGCQGDQQKAVSEGGVNTWAGESGHSQLHGTTKCIFFHRCVFNENVFLFKQQAGIFSSMFINNEVEAVLNAGILCVYASLVVFCTSSHGDIQ